MTDDRLHNLETLVAALEARVIELEEDNAILHAGLAIARWAISVLIPLLAIALTVVLR